jgi:hypothetical protein
MTEHITGPASDASGTNIDSIVGAVGAAITQIPMAHIQEAAERLHAAHQHVSTVAAASAELSSVSNNVADGVLHAGRAIMLVSDARRSLVAYLRDISGTSFDEAGSSMRAEDVTALPEWELLAGADVATTVATSESQPDIAAEVKRTLCSVQCRRYIHEGGDAAYEAFTRHQPEATRLSRADFDALSAWERSIVDDDETAVAADVIMLLHDIAKSGRVYDTMGLQLHEVDHDEALRLLLHDERYVAARLQLLPSLERLSPTQWQLVRDVLGIAYNYPQTLQGEAPAAEVLNIPDTVSQKARDIFILHAMLDIAGAAGHTHPEGSVTLTGPAYRRMSNLNRVLQDPTLSAEHRNEAFLDAELQHFLGGSLPEDLAQRQQLRAVVRLACHVRAETTADFTSLLHNFTHQPPVVQAVLTAELNRTASARTTLPYYSPALLRTLIKKEGPEFAFAFFAHILQEAHIADKEARQAGHTGVATVQLGDLVRAINQGTIDLHRNPIRFRMQDGGLVPVPYEPTLTNLEGMSDFSGTETMRGKRIIVVGEGGGSDGMQAAMVGKLAAAKYGCTVSAVVSVRSEARRITGSGQRIGQTIQQIAPDTRPVGNWRFLEDALLEGEDPAPAYLLNSTDPMVIAEDMQALLAVTGADIIIGVDTGGDSLYRGEHAGFSAHLPTEITPDHDYNVVQALSAVADAQPNVSMMSVIVAPGIDSPPYAREVLDEIGAQRIPLTDDDIGHIRQAYATWGMDGSGSERGRYGKTPLAWLHALQGRFGTQLLDLPRANVTSTDNPWRAFTAITPAMANIVAMDMRRHFTAIKRAVHRS